MVLLLDALVERLVVFGQVPVVVKVQDRLVELAVRGELDDWWPKRKKKFGKKEKN